MFTLHAQEQKHKIKIAGDSEVLEGDDKVSDGKRGSILPGLVRLLETLSKQEESEQDSQQNPEVDDAVAFRASNAANSTLEIITSDPPLADKTIVPITAATLPANLPVSQNQQANAINDIDQPTMPSYHLPPISSRTWSRSKPVAASFRTIKPKTQLKSSVQRVQDPPTLSLQNPFKKIKSEEIKSEFRYETVENTYQVSRTLMDFVIESGTPFSTTQSPKFTDLIKLIRSNDVKNQIALNENFPERFLNERYEKIMEN
ncbi:hypothetical protein HK098_006826 [Nowakowskiella sp. JEL0407]|nr:hypothetical protein HK098_006826 [Nowakowskiella sp. JEL0407]